MTPSLACTTDDPPDPRASLGVLFVHGMGTHGPGKTLRAVGDPLIEWLDNGVPGVNVVRSDEREPSPAGGPARVTCTIHDESANILTTWRLAESCWSDAFEPASYRRMAGWLIGSVPWMLGEYVRGACQREAARETYPWFRPLRQYLLIPFYALLGAVLAGPAIVFLAALVLLQRLDRPLRNMLPPGLRWISRVLTALQRVLASSLGDVYVILATEDDRQQIRERIKHDYACLTGCTRTVVVAHSAGAALTHELIRDEELVEPQPPAAFITFGEAAWRMRWMKRIQERTAPRLLALAMAIIGMALAAVSIFGGQPLAVKIGSGVLAALVYACLTRFVWGRADTAETRNEVLQELASKVRWCDFVASSDPIPSGTLTALAHAPDATAAAAGYEARFIRNRRSIVLDHTGYTKNLEEFVGGLAADLNLADGSLLPIEDGALDTDIDHRRLRTLTLALTRLGGTAVAGFILLALACDDGALARLGGHAAWASDLLRSILPRDLHVLVTAGPTGLAVAAILLSLPWLATRIGWGAWDRNVRARLLSQTTPATHGWAVPAMAVEWPILTAAGAGAALALADVGVSLWTVAAAVVLAIITVMLLFVRQVADRRDAIYSG